MHKKKGSGLEPWPLRLTTASPRLEEIGVSLDEFQKDTVSTCITGKELSNVPFTYSN